MLVSIALGLGFTFWSGAAEAWLVDALKHAGYDQPIEGVFAKSQIAFGVAMLIGTTAGGLLGQLDLRVPYVVRAVLLVPIIVDRLDAHPGAGAAQRRTLTPRHAAGRDEGRVRRRRDATASAIRSCGRSSSRPRSPTRS